MSTFQPAEPRLEVLLVCSSWEPDNYPQDSLPPYRWDSCLFGQHKGGGPGCLGLSVLEPSDFAAWCFIGDMFIISLCLSVVVLDMVVIRI